MYQRMSKLVVVPGVLLAVGGLVLACGSSSSKEPQRHAVGTYIGGGSIFGADNCTYTGSAPAVFEGADKPATEPANGPRYVTGAGTITKDCNGTKTKYAATVPTGVTITGPATVKVGSTNNDHFRGALVANGKQLEGEPYLDWTLGPDCAGIAEFGPVMGAQDTGGKDKTRTLVTKSKGTCTVLVTATTGDSALYPSFKGATFKAEKKVTIE